MENISYINNENQETPACQPLATVVDALLSKDEAYLELLRKREFLAVQLEIEKYKVELSYWINHSHGDTSNKESSTK